MEKTLFVGRLCGVIHLCYVLSVGLTKWQSWLSLVKKGKKERPSRGLPFFIIPAGLGLGPSAAGESAAPNQLQPEPSEIQVPAPKRR